MAKLGGLFVQVFEEVISLVKSQKSKVESNLWKKSKNTKNCYPK